MEYVYGYCLPTKLATDDLDLELWFPILDGDHSSIHKIGDGIPLHKLLAKLQPGDSLVSDEDHVESIYDLFHDIFIERPAYWSSERKLEFTVTQD